MNFNLDNIIQECLIEKAKVLNTARGKSTEAKINIYAHAWIALNAWLEYRLSRQKTATVAGFATFGWEMLEKDGETHCRPIFFLTDDFVKTHRVRRQRLHHVPQLTPSEEINYSMLAIKFSKTLTKDMIFTALRDIVRKTGEFISRGAEMEVEFTFGVLKAKESRVKFTFNQARLLQILPENIEPGVLSRTDQPLRYIEQRLDETSDDFAIARREGTANSQRSYPESTPRLQAGGGLSFASLRPGTGRGSGKPPLVPSLSLNMTATVQEEGGGEGEGEGYQDEEEGQEGQEQSPAPSLQELLAMVEKHRKNKSSAKSQARERVMSQAFQRCLQEMDRDASQEDRRRFEAMRKDEAFQTTSLQEKDRSKQQVSSLKQALDEQMEEVRRRQEQAREEKRTTIMRFILPENAGMAPSPLGATFDEQGQVVNSRRRIAEDLARQIEKNAQTREMVKKETKQREKEYLERLSVENELQGIIQRSRYLESQKALVEAWERDGHLRNVRRLQPLGAAPVSDYIARHLKDPDLQMSRLPESLEQSLQRSIGYDPRRGKI